MRVIQSMKWQLKLKSLSLDGMNGIMPLKKDVMLYKESK